MSRDSDTICSCTHWFEEHDSTGICMRSACECETFQYASDLNTVEAIRERTEPLDHFTECQCALCDPNGVRKLSTP